jgi:hypothetical protein
MGFQAEKKHIVASNGNTWDIDLFIPEKNIGIELNGVYYHQGLPRLYHAEKTQKALEMGIKLYHFWDDTPIYKIKRILSNKLGVTSGVFAKDLTLAHVDWLDISHFYEAYHRHGAGRKSSINYALLDNDGIVSAMNFVVKGSRVELLRYCTRSGIQVVGGAHRLLSNSIRAFNALYLSELFTYCDRDLSPCAEDTVYARYGFTFVGDSGPMLRYYAQQKVPSKKGVLQGIYSREDFIKKKLPEYWDDVDMTKTADEILKNHGINTLYNSGNFKFKLDL